MPRYEVWCHSCNVTFPVGTRVCLHCGGRTRPDPPPSRRGHEPQMMFADPRFGAGPLEMSGPAAGRLETSGLDRPAAGRDESVEEDPIRRSALRTGMTLLWLILLAAGYAWRACSQQ